MPIILAAAFAFTFWEAFGRHVDEGHPGLAEDVTAFTLVAPPPQATKIWVAGYRQGPMAFAHYVRFEAPPAVCVHYASAIVPGIALAGPDNFHTSLDANVFHSMSWFDLDKAATLVGGGGRVPRPNIHMWVDTTRGVFYFVETD